MVVEPIAHWLAVPRPHLVHPARVDTERLVVADLAAAGLVVAAEERDPVPLGISKHAVLAVEVAVGFVTAQRTAQVISRDAHLDYEPRLPDQPRERLQPVFGYNVRTLQRVGEEPGCDHLTERLALLDCPQVTLVEFRSADKAHGTAPANEVAETSRRRPKRRRPEITAHSVVRDGLLEEGYVEAADSIVASSVIASEL